MTQLKDFSKYLKVDYHDQILEFIGDDSQTDSKLGDILIGLKDPDALHFLAAFQELTINKIVDAVISQNFDKWSKRILEIRENLQIKQICPDAKIVINTYEEIKFSLSEIRDSQVTELTKMFNEYSITITVESNLLLVSISKDDNEDS